jgi:23S rRNA (cytidine1920-2'-O)/16S rRNA (cytidine1409-2'-O)-methyltransferase
LAKTLRLDAELVRRGLAESRSAARHAIEAGRVVVRGMPATRVATMVSPEDSLSITGSARRFVSRGGEKLDGALDRLNVAVEGRAWLDAGASTGGFTDCLLQRGAATVIAVDVGYGQLDWGLRNDERVAVLERTNVRTLAPADLPRQPDAAAADLSFISLTLVLPALAKVVAHQGDWLLMVKPQFEVGKDAVGKGGVVSDPALWLEAVLRVVDAAAAHGLGLVDATPSALPGQAGNREFFVHLNRGGPHNREAAALAVAEISS